MPYRAMLFSIFTVVLSLAAVAFWVRTVGPVVAEVDAVAASEPKNVARAVPPPATGIAAAADPSREGQTVGDFSRRMHRVVPGTMILSFVLISLLLVVGFAATFREWARYSTQRRVASRERTPYVDAWKLAGERATLENPGDHRERPDPTDD